MIDVQATIVDLRFYTSEELNELHAAIEIELGYRGQDSILVESFTRGTSKEPFKVGDPVQFTHKQILHQGTIVKLNPKRASVHVETMGDWRVPYILLRKA